MVSHALMMMSVAWRLTTVMLRLTVLTCLGRLTAPAGVVCREMDLCVQVINEDVSGYQVDRLCIEERHVSTM